MIATLLFGVAEGSRAQSYITDLMTVDSQDIAPSLIRPLAIILSH